MKKKGLLKGIVLSAACLLGFGTLIGATIGLFQNKTYEIAEAATETKATLTKDNIIAASSSESSEATINGITFDWGDTEFTVSGSTLSVDADHCPNILVASSHLSSNNVTHVSVNISYTAAALNTTLQIIEGFTNKLVNISLTGTSYSSGDVSIDNSKMLMIKIMNNGNDELNKLTISSFSLDLKGIPAKSAVTIAKGTGVKSVYLSTSNTATSGSASGTKYDYGTTVYGFAELAKGYNAASGWTLVSGTANTEGAKYRVGSVSAGSSNFGTVNASLASYTISYNLNSGALPSGKTNPSSYNVNSNNITLNNPTRTGYTFKGWSGTGLTGDTNKSVTISKGSIGNRSYTANWNLYNYIINYNLDGGHETVSNPINYTIETNTFTLNNPGRDGRDFVGWTGSNGSNPQTTVTIAKGSTGDKSYLANWALTAEVQAIYDKINAIGTPSSYYPGSKAAISDAKDAIDALQVAYPGWDWSNIGTIIPNYGNYLSAEAAYDSERETDISDAITAIDALPSDTSSISYPEDRDLVFTALNNYNALSQEDKENEISVERLHLLNQCVAVYNEAKDNTVAAVIEAIDAIGTVSYPDSASAIEAAEDLYSTLHQDEKDSGAVTNYATLTTARSEYNSQRDVTVAGVISDIEAIPNPLVYPDSLVVIETAEASFNALNETEQESGAVTNKDDLVCARAAYDTIVLIEKIKDATTSTQYEEYYEAAQSAFDALTPEQKAFIPNSFKDDLNDASDISAVMSLIDAIGDLTYNAGTNDSLADIEAAEEAYNALTPEQKALVDNYNHDTLVEDRASYDKVDDAVNLINSIGDVTHGGAGDSKEAIDAAREAYDALTPAEQALVNSYNNFGKVLVDDEKVYEAMRLIDEIGNLELTDECGERIDAAKDYFDSLTADQIAVLTSKGYAKEFEDKDAAYDTMVKIDAMNWATDSKDFGELCEAAEAAYGALTADQEALIPDDFKDALADDKAANEVMSLIDAIGDLTYNAGTNDSLADIEAAEEAYNALTPEQKALVDNYNHDTLVEDRASYDKVDDAVNLVNSIGDVTHGGASDSKEAIDAAREAYDNLTPEEKALVDAYGNTKKVLEDDEKVYEAMRLIDEIGNLELTDECGERIDAAKDYFDSLTADQIAALTNAGYTKTLEDKEAAFDAILKIDDVNLAADSTDFNEAYEAAQAYYDSLSADQKALIPDDFKDALADDKAANEVMSLIDAIGDLTYNAGTNDSLADIEAAEEAYNALTPEQKALVDNYNHDTLVEDRESYDKVDDAVNLINSIGDVTHGGASDSKEAIDAAREAYDNLTPEEKALVDAYGNTKKVLEDDEKVYETMEVINKVGEVSYDTKTEEALEEARVAYEALTEDQKAQLREEYLDKLTRSEERYQGLQKGSNITVIILLVLVSLITVGGGLFLFLVLKKKNKGSVKAMSVSGFLPFMIFASHYADTPWIVVYILSGVAVLVWAAGLAFFIMKKKQIGPFKKKEEPVTNEMNKEEAKVEEAMKEEQVLASTQNTDVSSNEDEEEVVTVTDEKGNIFQIRFIKSFTAKLSQASDEVKNYYNIIKNHVLSYKKANSRVSWHYDSINVGRDQVMKFSIRGKTLCVYYALDEVDEKYKVERVESKKFADVPLLYRIKNDRRCNYAKELVDLLMNELHIEKGEEPNKDFSIPYEETQALIERGLIKELKTKVEKPIEQHHGTISVSEADEEMSDEAAEAKIEEDKTSKKHEGKKGVINIDTIGENFNDGDLVNLEALWAKKLVPNNVGYVKVLARGTLNKRLNVDLQDYSIQAVKMILLEGGTVKKAK